MQFELSHGEIASFLLFACVSLTEVRQHMVPSALPHRVPSRVPQTKRSAGVCTCAQYEKYCVGNTVLPEAFCWLVFSLILKSTCSSPCFEKIITWLKKYSIRVGECIISYLEMSLARKYRLELKRGGKF